MAGNYEDNESQDKNSMESYGKGMNSTNDILHQYVSTIKALRTIDPAGVFLEAVGEPIREYLRGRKDTIKYRVMLAEKLLNKTDYDIETEIRTLELLKIHFGENSMQKCEIMLNDLIDSKRTNTNVKATINQLSQTGAESQEHEASFDILDTTIMSSNFWPSIQGIIAEFSGEELMLNDQ